MIGERKLYNTMRSCHISTLDVHWILGEVGIEMPKRTLQHHLDNDMTTCKDERVEKVINKLIVEHKKLLTSLKSLIKKQTL